MKRKTMLELLLWGLTPGPAGEAGSMWEAGWSDLRHASLMGEAAKFRLALGC